MAFNIDQFDKYSRILVGWISIIASLTGGFIALNTYLQSAESERAKETLKYRERFDLPRYVVPIKKIEESLKTRESELTRAIEKGDEAATRYVTGLIRDEKIETLKALVVEPAHWVFDKKGLTVTFNPYEVAPYAAGAPEVTIPWSALTSGLNPVFSASLPKAQTSRRSP